MRATVGENVEVICSDNVNLAQLFLNEGIIETADAKKKKNCELFSVMVGQVVLVCYSEAVVYVLWKKANESL